MKLSRMKRNGSASYYLNRNRMTSRIEVRTWVTDRVGLDSQTMFWQFLTLGNTCVVSRFTSALVISLLPSCFTRVWISMGWDRGQAWSDWSGGFLSGVNSEGSSNSLYSKNDFILCTVRPRFLLGLPVLFKNDPG